MHHTVLVFYQKLSCCIFDTMPVFEKKPSKNLLQSLLNSPFRGHSLCTFSTLWRPLFWILSFISWLSENYSPSSLYVFKICVEVCLSKVFTALLLFRLGICTTKSWPIASSQQCAVSSPYLSKPLSTKFKAVHIYFYHATDLNRTCKNIWWNLHLKNGNVTPGLERNRDG